MKPGDVYALLASRRDALLIDVRESDEYERRHLERAIHLSRGVLEMRIYKYAKDKNVPVVCVCNGGKRSALAADNLQKMGYTNVFIVEGGLNAAFQLLEQQQQQQQQEQQQEVQSEERPNSKTFASVQFE